MNANKHILFFIFSMSGGGAERVTANLANHWAGKGHRVTIVTLKDASHDVYDLEPTIDRVSLGLDGGSPSVFAAVINNFRRIHALRRCLRELRPDVAIAMMPMANSMLALSGRSGAETRMGSERAYPPHFPLGTFWEAVRRQSYRKLDHIVAQTPKMRDWIVENTSASSVVVIHNPIPYPLPSSTPEILPSDHLTKGRKALLSVGRLTPQKAYDRLLRAFADLAGKFPEWDLAIVGEGPLRTQHEELAEELGIRDRVKLPGQVGNLADWYRRADLFVLTSKFEGFPNVLAEALAHGLPAVSVDCDTGPRDIIRDGVDGLLVPQNNHGALVNGLEQLMNDAETRKAYGERATSIRDRLAIDKIAAQWEALF